MSARIARPARCAGRTGSGQDDPAGGKERVRAHRSRAHRVAWHWEVANDRSRVPRTRASLSEPIERTGAYAEKDFDSDEHLAILERFSQPSSRCWI